MEIMENKTRYNKNEKTADMPLETHMVKGHPFMTSTRNQIFDHPGPHASTFDPHPWWTFTCRQHEIHISRLKQLVH